MSSEQVFLDHHASSPVIDQAPAMAIDHKVARLEAHLTLPDKLAAVVHMLVKATSTGDAVALVTSAVVRQGDRTATTLTLPHIASGIALLLLLGRKAHTTSIVPVENRLAKFTVRAITRGPVVDNATMAEYPVAPSDTNNAAYGDRFHRYVGATPCTCEPSPMRTWRVTLPVFSLQPKSPSGFDAWTACGAGHLLKIPQSPDKPVHTKHVVLEPK